VVLKSAPIPARARGIVNSYDTGVTLRELFYRLVAEQLLPNTAPMYRHLSNWTAKLAALDRSPNSSPRPGAPTKLLVHRP
jgi:hypothetical protein